ncbi:tunicamycin resistance protein [Coemansia javaensis]|uniref:UDP-N-acetylglucosamine--dolichyl-phosphate N-acetylglucosaminephosphotransferase n=1 Tax=Coemansia javaensis TaxID=2761396 RepID=A0A9W8HGX2_9FUNG|nr:tunicamycin resistance protein [Coemansia javaensis]
MLHAKATAALAPVLAALAWQQRDQPLAVCVCISALAGLATWCAVPATVAMFKRAGLSGADLAKPARPVLAESMGVVAATIYLVATFLFIPAQFRGWWWRPTDDHHQPQPHSRHVFPFDRLGEYLSALLSLQSMVFLGFADDVVDLRWRFKLILPTVASVPVLTVYYVGYGVTHVAVPVFMRAWLGTHTVDLGVLYYVYIGMMAVFCTNAINILAGINGVEVGQSIVIALSIVAKDVANINSDNPEAGYHHLFSLYLLLPFVAVSSALYYWNVYPARVFVGDTYCYFAGMTFAVCGILGHFSKTLLLLFVPQIFNFVYSAPQIFGLVPCPRHRLPALAVETALPPALAARLARHRELASADDASSDNDSDAAASGLHRTVSTAMRSFAAANPRPRPRARSGGSAQAQVQATTAYLVPSRTALAGARPLGLLIVRAYERLGLADVERDARGAMTSVNNLTLLNLVLVRSRRRRLGESQLNNRILAIQVLNSAVAFVIRYRLAHVFYD